MSQMYHSLESIMTMLDRKYTKEDIKQALADLEAMRNSVDEYKYRSIKALLEAKL